MIEHWEIKLEPKTKKESKYSLYIDGSKKDVVLLLTKLANLCARPVKVEKPYTFALPLLEADPHVLAHIEKLTAELVKKTAELFNEKEKPESIFGKLQKPAEVLESSQPDELTEEIEGFSIAKLQEEMENIQKPEEEVEAESQNYEQETEKEISASRMLEQQLGPEKDYMPDEEKKEHKTASESDILEDIEQLSKDKFSMSNELTKYLDIELQKIQEGKSEHEKPAGQPATMEEISLDSLNIPLKPQADEKEKPALPGEAEIPKPPAKTDREFSVANVELNIPDLSDEISKTDKLQDLQTESMYAAPSEMKMQTEAEFKEPTQATLQKPYELTTDSTCTFDNLKPASNRFAHAAVMSAMDSLGSMYNPLILIGTSGTGKTHFINAMLFDLTNRIGRDKIFATDAIKITNAVKKLSAEGKISELDDKITNCQVLMIDDFHLLEINQLNKPYLSKWLNGFIDEQKQIVLTSRLPLKDLSAIENKTDFWLSQGWAVDLKQPDKKNYNEIAKFIMDKSGIEIDQSQQDKYFPPNKFDLNHVKKTCNRIKTLEFLMADKKLSQTDLLDFLTGNKDKLMSGQFGEEELEKSKEFPSFSAAPWGSWAFFVPKDETEHVNALAVNIAEKMKEFSISGGFKLRFIKEYQADDLKSAVPEIFKNSNSNEIKGVVVISPPSVMHEEVIHQQFCCDLEHMLNSIGVCISCVDIDKLQFPSSVFQIISDLAGCK
jgi:chromosomal replication initiator protein